MAEERQYAIPVKKLEELTSSRQFKVLLPAYVKEPIFKRFIKGLQRGVKRDQELLYVSESMVYEFLSSDVLNHPVKIEWLPQIDARELPKNEQIDERIWNVMNDLCVVLVEYHNKPIITDEFADHNDRVKKREIWRRVLDGVFYDVLRQTKLARNHLFSVGAMLDGARTRINALPEKNQKTEQLLALVNKIDYEIFCTPSGKNWRDYDSMQSSNHDSETEEQKAALKETRDKSWTNEERLEFAYTINPKIVQVLKEIEGIFTSS